MPISRQVRNVFFKKWTSVRLTFGFLLVFVIYIYWKYGTHYYLRKEYSANHINLPYIYVITPTRKCLTQKADLTRLSHTLMHVPNLIWVVVEDMAVKTQQVTSFLDKTTVKSVHLNVASNRSLPNMKGMTQRNEGLKWLKKNRENHKHNGIVYFADVDNTYSLDLFAQMRSIKWISVWPVGLIPPLYESPVVKNGKVVGWIAWATKVRRFAVDMAGFAFNIKVLDKFPKLAFQPTVPGYQENFFLLQFVSKLEELEPGANNCSEILVWHTITCYAPAIKEKDSQKQGFPLEM